MKQTILTSVFSVLIMLASSAFAESYSCQGIVANTSGKIILQCKCGEHEILNTRILHMNPDLKIESISRQNNNQFTLVITSSKSICENAADQNVNKLN